MKGNSLKNLMNTFEKECDMLETEKKQFFSVNWPTTY